MKRIFDLAIILLCTTLTACVFVSTTETEIEVTVTGCERGEFHPHPTYAAAALKPMMDCSGVFSSWDTLAVNS